MDPEFEGLTEGDLKEMLDKAEDYDERSKIRKALRTLKKSKGQISRNTGSSVYRRPGFQTPRSVQIPNSVTGNVLPSSLKDNEPIKPPDKNTPTIGYLNATTVVSQKRPAKKTSSQSGYSQQSDAYKENETWWTNKSQTSSRSSRSQTPSDTTEQNAYSGGGGSMDPVFTDDTKRDPTPEPVRDPTPEPVRDPTPEPVRDPTPEPVRDPTPEPVRDPTPEPVRDPTPEPVRDLTPEPVRDPTPEPVRDPTPEPVRDPTPEPVRAPTPEPVNDSTPESLHDTLPSPDPEPYRYGDDRDINEEDDIKDEEGFSDEDEELRVLEERSKVTSDPPQLNVGKSLPLDVLQKVEPGLEEKKDFRTKLRKAEDTKIDTKAAFPNQKKQAEQLDFRNVLRKTTGPEKKSFKVEQVDFRGNLKPKDEYGSEENLVDDNTSAKVDRRSLTPELHVTDSSSKDVISPEEKVVSPEEKVTSPEEKVTSPEAKVTSPEAKVTSPDTTTSPAVDEDSYEARREARRKEKERREKEMKELESKALDSVTNGLDEDSYEARREARRKARETRRLKEQQESNKPKELTYREKQQLEQAKKMAENKKKWDSLDQANSNGNLEKPAVSRQTSSNAKRGAQQLLAWCQHKTHYYENVEVTDFSHSFANGLALCAILHTFVPDDIPFDELTPDNRAENFSVALQVSENLGIGSFFDLDDLMSVKAPDPKSMMTFLATIYQHFK